MSTTAPPPPHPAADSTAPRRWRLRGWRERIDHFWQSRLRASDTVLLTQRNVYILPTRAGWMLAVTLLVLLLASINYQLNLGYALTFLLAGSAIAGMHVGHGTLRGLRLQMHPPEPAFAGQPCTLSVHLHNERRSDRHGIGLSLNSPQHWSWCDVGARASCTVQLRYTPTHRGEHALPLLRAQTLFPLGTFKVWTVWRAASRLLVYPAPEPLPPPLPVGSDAHSGRSAPTPHSSAPTEYDGVRAYRRGDPLKTVVWKKAAKSDLLVSRDQAPTRQSELWLDATRCGAPNTEARLSRLCAWVLLADRRGLPYGLRLGATEIPPQLGDAHRLACLRALALHPPG